MKIHFLSLVIASIFLVSCDKDNSCVPASIADAGSDQEGFTVNLQANEPESGTGKWRIYSGSEGLFENDTDPSTTFSGEPGIYKLVWTIEGCPSSSDTVTVTLLELNSSGYALSKSSGIAGEIIKVYGPGFSPNPYGTAQIHWEKSGGFSNGAQGVFPDLSFTDNVVQIMVYPTNGGELGEYILSHAQAVNSSIEVTPIDLTFNIVAPAEGQFHTSSTLSKTGAAKGTEVSVGVRNGGANADDYSIALISPNRQTGILDRYSASVIAFNRIAVENGGTAMDEVRFAIPNDIPSGMYRVEVTDKKSGVAMIGGWNSYLNVN